MNLRPYLALVASLALCGTSAQAQVLLNGSFESPTVTKGTNSAMYWLAGAGQSYTQYNNSSSTFGTTPYGSQFLVLPSGDTISQTISGFVKGENYVLGVDFYDLDATAGTFTLSVAGADNTSEALSFPGTTGTNGSQFPFQSGVLIFTASSSGIATISFTSSQQVAIDNVALYGNVPISPATPEPATDAELLLGVGALGLFLRRQAARA